MTWGQSAEVVISPEPSSKRRVSTPIYTTKYGAMYCGLSEQVVRTHPFRRHEGKVQLVLTSPPFPLQTKKQYGNHQGEEYIEWFANFAAPLKKFLTRDGSIVVEIGNVWEAGRPVMSTTVLRALLAFLERGGLQLCQEFIWYNHARLPSPAQWVNVERIRVKDAFTRIWWMSTTDRPKADNTKVLREYSSSMRQLIETKKYNSKRRPSAHNIGKSSFAKNNNGAIPPNVLDCDDVPTLGSILKATNTRSIEPYQVFCRQRNIPVHPARMPRELVEFFVQFLTDEKDLVLDPFGGSNTTGSIAETYKRRWLTIEKEWSYATASISRFSPNAIRSARNGVEIIQLDQAASAGSFPIEADLIS